MDKTIAKRTQITAMESNRNMDIAKKKPNKQ